MTNMQTLVAVLKNHSIDVVGFDEGQGLITVIGHYTKEDGDAIIPFFVKETLPATKKDVYEWLGY